MIQRKSSKRSNLSLAKREQLFRAKAFEVHGDQFLYLKPYVSRRTPTEVWCTEHKVSFGIRLQDHLLRPYGGCWQCGRDVRAEKMESNARKVHGEQFWYCDDFHSTKYPMSMFCRKHGELFTQKPYDHLYSPFSGGCPECKKWVSWSEDEVDHYCDDTRASDDRDPRTHRVFRACPKCPAFSVSSKGGLVLNRVKTAKHGFRSFVKTHVAYKGYLHCSVGDHTTSIHKVVARTFGPRRSEAGM